MLATLVQTKTGTSNLASTLVTFDNNTVAGNSIIVVSGNSSSTAGDVSGVTDSQGNTYTKILATANTTIGEIEIWYASGIIGGANTVTVAYTTGVACAVIIREYYGLIYANSSDKQASNTGNSSSLSSSNTTALTQTNELLVGAGLIPLANTFSAGGSFVNLVSTGAPLVVAVAAEDLFVTNGGVQSATFTANASVQWVCAIATFFLSPTGTTTSTSSTSISSTSTSSTSSSISSTSSSTSSTSSSVSSTSTSISTSSTSTSLSITTFSTSSTSSSTSSTSTSSTSTSTSFSSTSTSISSTSTSSTSISSTSSSTSLSSTSTSFSSTSSSISSTSSSVSSTSFSSTSSSSSTSTTTLPPPYVTYSYQDENAYTVVQQFTPSSASTWTCPVNVTAVKIECWAGGGSGAAGGNATSGGGGGAYSRLNSLTVTPGTSYTVTVGTGGAALAAQGAGNNGNDSWFSSSATVLAKGGTGGNAGTNATSAAGGAAGSGVGDVKYSGGASGTAGSGGGASGGGGGAGSQGDGTASANAGAGTSAGGIGGGGAYGGVGTIGVVGGGTAGATACGGGSGGAGNGGTTTGAGGGGLVQLTYTATAPPTTNSNLLNLENAAQYGNESTDDGDYFIQYGTNTIIQEFKETFPNNTNNINITWKGRSTVSTVNKPIYLQLYNQNSATWETLDYETLQPADTDFTLSGSQTTNLSNYYDSTNTISCRVYQQVN